LIFVCSYLLWYRNTDTPFQIQWFVWAQTAAYGISAFLAVFMGHKTIGRAKIKFKKLFSIVILRQAFPYAVLILLMMIYNRMDSVMLERIHPDGASQAGIYAQGFRLLDAVNMFALLFAGLLLPICARMLSQKLRIDKLVQYAGSMLFISASIFAIASYYYAFEIMNWRYSEHVLEASESFRYLILSFIPIALTYIFGTILTANGSLKQLNSMAILGLLTNFMLNWILIPKMGASGAAIATLGTQWFTAIIQIILAIQILKMRFEIAHTLKIFVFLFAFIFLASMIHLYSNHLLSYVVLVFVALFISAALGILPIKKSLSLLLNKKVDF
jgi:O-antigen/teichoic acid export membrane protein